MLTVLEALAGGGVALVTLDHLILGIFWPQSGGVTLQSCARFTPCISSHSHPIAQEDKIKMVMQRGCRSTG